MILFLLIVINWVLFKKLEKKGKNIKIIIQVLILQRLRRQTF